MGSGTGGSTTAQETGRVGAARLSFNRRRTTPLLCRALTFDSRSSSLVGLDAARRTAYRPPTPPMTSSISAVLEPIISAFVNELESVLQLESQKLVRALLEPLAPQPAPKKVAAPRSAGRRKQPTRTRGISARSEAATTARTRSKEAARMTSVAAGPSERLADTTETGRPEPEPPRVEVDDAASAPTSERLGSALVLDLSDATTDESGQRLVRVVRRKRVEAHQGM